MPSTLTRPVATRLEHYTIDMLERMAARQGITLSMLLRLLAEEAVRQAER